MGYPVRLDSVVMSQFDAMQWQKTQNLASGDKISDMQWVYSDRQREEMLTVATMGRSPFATKFQHYTFISIKSMSAGNANTSQRCC